MNEVSVAIGVATTLLCGLFAIFHSGIRRMAESWICRFSLWCRNSEDQNGQTAAVSGLFVYPVKSLRAVEVSHTTLDSMGFVGDRRFMLVCPSPPPPYGFLKSDPTHRFITQRQCPVLATVQASVPDSSQLHLSCNGTAVSVSLIPRNDAETFGARIWNDVVKVRDLGDEAARFFQKIVGNDEEWQGIRLVRIDSKREADDNYVPAEARTLLGTTPRVALSDGFPILIAFEASLDELNRRLSMKGKAPIPMSRFRPNIVIRNTRAFEEDTWKVISVGSTVLHLVKGCPRCKQSCTDQLTGEVHEEPLATLKEFRALGYNKEDAYFAQNAIAYGKSLSVGDSVCVLKRGSPVWDRESVAAE